MMVDRLYCECLTNGSHWKQLHNTFYMDRLYCECALLMEVIGSSFEQYVLHMG